VLEGLWRWEDLDRFTFQDLIEAHDYLDWRAENQQRMAAYLALHR